GQPAAEPGAVGGALAEPVPVVLVLQQPQRPVDQARDHPIQPECRPEAPQDPGHDRAKTHGADYRMRLATLDKLGRDVPASVADAGILRCEVWDNSGAV